jgi:hypothetical protein
MPMETPELQLLLQLEEQGVVDNIAEKDHLRVE